MKTSPTQRSLKLLRSRGWTPGIVERRIPFHHVTIDLFGWVDIVAIKPYGYGAADPVRGGEDHGGILFVQTTTGANAAARRAKIEASDTFQTAKLAGARVELHGWSKKGARGKRKTWECRVEEM